MTDTPPPARRRGAIILAGVVLLLLCAVCSTGVVLYPGDVQGRGILLRGGSTDPGASVANVRLQNVNTTTSDALLRVRLEPRGSLAGAAGTLAQTGRLVARGTSRPVFDFPANQPPTPYELTVDLGGVLSDYPLDQHDGLLLLELLAVATDGSTTQLPLAVAFDGWLSGITTEATITTEAGLVGIDMAFSRPGTTIYFVVLVGILMWALSLAALVQAVLLAMGRRKLEATLFSFMAAMLFAFPALRNTFPGAPPVGALFDYLVFFWVEAITGFALLIALLTWILRPAPKP